MNTYHKIQTVFKRNLDLPKKPIIIGDWTLPEFEYLKEFDICISVGSPSCSFKMDEIKINNVSTETALDDISATLYRLGDAVTKIKNVVMHRSHLIDINSSNSNG